MDEGRTLNDDGGASPTHTTVGLGMRRSLRLMPTKDLGEAVGLHAQTREGSLSRSRQPVELGHARDPWSARARRCDLVGQAPVEEDRTAWSRLDLSHLVVATREPQATAAEIAWDVDVEGDDRSRHDGARIISDNTEGGIDMALDGGARRDDQDVEVQRGNFRKPQAKEAIEAVEGPSQTSPSRIHRDVDEGP